MAIVVTAAGFGDAFIEPVENVPWTSSLSQLKFRSDFDEAT